ncbi:MAG TPA: energy transducer TonB [Candidatus Acidoferrum sp.]
MRDPMSGPFGSNWSLQNSLVHRIRENLQQMFAPARIFPSSANGAPLHLLRLRPYSVADKSRTISFLGHVLLISGMLLLHVQSQPQKGSDTVTGTTGHEIFTFYPPPGPNHFGSPSLGIKGGGGENDSRPARHGLLAPASSRPLLPPRQIVNANPELPVPPAVFDPNAARFPVLVTNLGLPWMKDNADSAGPGKDHGFGTGKKGGMGDNEGPEAGQGDSYSGPYANVVTGATCVYCPDPQYTDEAREAKLQGKVMLRVLVGADGRALQIQIVQGIGMGLDDRAVQSVRGWKFAPARDAAHHAVSMWVTVEVVFRLI